MEVRARTCLRAWGLAVLAAALIASVLCLGQNVIDKKFDLSKEKGGKNLLVSFDYSDIFDDKSKEKLSSGLPTVVLMRLFLHPEGEKKPVSMTLRKCKIIYDIWEEHYIVTISTAGKKTKTKKIKHRAETAKICSSVKKLRYSIDDVKEGNYRFSAVIDRNPLSKEVLEAMRNWLKRPLGDSGHLNPADSFFGSFVTIFVNEKIEPSEKMIKVASQKFKIKF